MFKSESERNVDCDISCLVSAVSLNVPKKHIANVLACASKLVRPI